jgi:hypothetical protein
MVSPSAIGARTLAVPSAAVEAERCSWCGESVERDDGFRATEPEGDRRATFCRLEHVVPWAMQGAHWEPGTPADPAFDDPGLERCAECDRPVGDRRVVIVRHRGEHRIPDAFCGVEHLLAWAKSGGRWR